MNHEDKLYLSDLNLSEFIREMARWDPAVEIIELDDLLVTKTGSTSPVTNVAICLGKKGCRSEEHTLGRIRSFYAERKSGFSIHVRSHLDAGLEALCRSENMHQISNTPGMVIEDSISEKPLPSGFDLRAAEDTAGIADFAAVIIDSYQSLGMPASIGSLIFACPERCIKPYNYMAVGYMNGAPVSCAMTLFSHSIAGIYWVGTVQNARGKGFAEACTRAVTNEAFRRGAVMVVLQASKFGEPIYRRMGFTEITKYPWYMCFSS